MVSAIATVLKSKLVNLPWIERFGGLVNVATRPIVAQGADGVSVVTGYQSCPVACDVNQANCWDNGLFKHFEPDSTKTAVAFFVDNGGIVFKQVEGPKLANLIFTFDLKFLCWMNLPRMGEDLTGGGCDVSGRLTPLVMKQFWGCHDAFGKFEGGPQEQALRGIEVKTLSQYRKDPSIFAPFTFATDGEKRGLFLYPYDYFGIRITGEFRVNTHCLEDIFFTPDSTYCLPGEGILPASESDNSILEEDNDEIITEDNQFIIQD